eukprot:gene731-1405_t
MAFIPSSMIFGVIFLSVAIDSFRFPLPKNDIMALVKINMKGHEQKIKQGLAFAAISLSFIVVNHPAHALEPVDIIPVPSVTVPSVSVSSQEKKTPTDYTAFKLPYNHENLPLKEFLGKATIVSNMKLDDPQTPTQYPILIEVFNKYQKDGLNLLIFPTEQGYFEPDDDETCRAKSKESFNFGSYPNGVVFDKVDLIGPSAHPLFVALTGELPTPNGYNRITLNYEKFLLNEKGEPLRRYPRKFSAYDMEADILAALKGEPLPPVTPEFDKAWREAKREATKSEYAFRLNYNYYNSPDSILYVSCYTAAVISARVFCKHILSNLLSLSSLFAAQLIESY